MEMFIHGSCSLLDELFNIKILAIFQGYLHQILVEKFKIEDDTSYCFVVGTIIHTSD
jgi:hypothetical protein